MIYYAIRVQPNKERIFLHAARKWIKDEECQFFFLRKKLCQRKNGKWKNIEQPLFPGYIFLSLAERLSAAMYWRFKSLAGFAYFLKQRDEFSQLRKNDLDLVQRFLSFGEVLGFSTVNFDTNQRIKVFSGPMTGLEGKIVSVDKRKKRAKILLNFDNKQVHIILGFDFIEKMAEQETQEYA